MVEVLLTEEERGGVGGQDHIWPVAPHGGDEGPTEVFVIGELAVRVTKRFLSGDAQNGGGCRRFGGPGTHQRSGVGPRVRGSLPPIGAEDDPDLTPGLRPGGES